ncbi:hypothetical protein [Janibacter indicus]|uniref:hypothetical protein n=1 Tax=Janibacter indicus TaxID=857417 RepID=UPI003EB900DB
MSRTKGARAGGLTMFRAEPGASRVDLGGGQLAPVRFYAETVAVDENGEGLDEPYERAVWSLDEDRRMVLDEYHFLRLPGVDVAASRVGGAGLEELGQRALDRLTWGAGGEVPHRLGVASGAERSSRRRALETTVRRGRPPLDDEDARTAAEVYLRAVEAGEPPSAAVREELGLTDAQVRKRLRRARDLGLVPEYRKGGRR